MGEKEISSKEFQKEPVEKDILQLNRLYATFSRIYQVIVTVHDKEVIFRRICEIAVEYGNLHFAWFGLIDSSGKYLIPITSARKDQGKKMENVMNISDEERIMSPKVQVIKEGKCIFCMDIATDPRIIDGRAEALKRGIHSSVTVPIHENSEVIGAFTTYSFAPMMFDAKELQLFEEIGMAISFALDTIYKEKQRNTIIGQLEKSEERFREMFDNAPMAYHELDDKGHIVRVNNTELAMLGYSAEEVLGQYSWNFVSDKEASHQRVLNKLSDIGLPSQNIEFKLIRKDGTPITVLAQDRLIRNDKGKVTGIRTILQDISELKKTEKELMIAKEKAEESDRLKTAFLHNISHEIRTPMNTIMGFSGLLNDPKLIPEEREHYTELIMQSSNELLSIITNLVNIATVEAGQEKIYEKEININAMFKQLCYQFGLNAKKQNITLNPATILPDPDANIITDATKVKEILDNLIGNALKYTSLGSIDFGYTIKGEFIEFYVKDTGIGIPAPKHEEIFKRFYQVEMDSDSRMRGSGLGLSICKAYVELLGGKIWLTSEQGKGSTFFFTIPYIKAGFGGSNENKPGKKPVIRSRSTGTLLIAEDEDLNFLLLEKLLSEGNFKIIRAVNGLEAVAICKSDHQVDLVLMDLKMPVVNGYDATKQIKEYRPGLPVLVQTAYINEYDKKRIFECGCSDIISKPIEQELLLAKIRQQLERLK